MPRVIHDKAEHHSVTEIIDLMAGRNLSNDQADYLETLSELSEAYETQNLPVTPKTKPNEFLAAHLSNIGMNFTEWGKVIGIDRSTASRLIRGERKLNTTHRCWTAHLTTKKLISSEISFFVSISFVEKEMASRRGFEPLLPP
jgi:HTH-type transcriptional regulator / antitoxin HigA